MKEFMTDGYDGKQIFVRLYDDVVAPKAVLIVIHGMCEHGARFDALARFFNANGYIVHIDDHRAHGKTESDADRGHCAGNIFKDTLKDELFFYDKLKEQYNLPVFVLGHSYGSFLAQAFAEEGTDCKAIGLIGTAYMSKMLVETGAALLWLPNLAFGSARPSFTNGASDVLFRYKGDSGASQWVVGDKTSRQQFLDDPMCGKPMSLGFCYYMCKGIGRLYTAKNRTKLSPTTAIGMFCGGQDPIGGYGKKVKKLDKFYRSVGVPTEMHIYPESRHEVHNDVDQKVALKDMVNFFDKYIKYQQTTIDDLLK